ncbi:MAG: tRNA 2-thiouridine(34) synthase MnmA [Phycisphaeraceae bacterium]|nr:tRNA 2-thiouridine(34) synthase MnmA [Phycisphaeraceae bacterium]
MSTAKPKVLVAMSGGVDSSVAAALLKRDGYDVVGCFMRLGSPGETLDEMVQDQPGACEAKGPKIGHQGCCSINDAADARLVAAELGVPFYVCNFKKDFGRIIDYFVDEYVAGRTPNPCVRCNDWLKFGKLHEYARQIGADFVASGHYARIGPLPQAPHVPRLLRAIDHTKDQSYVLFGMPHGQLGHTLLPIGGYYKPQVRDLAKEFGLPVFDKPDSQEICFVSTASYADLVETRRPGSAKRGDIVDETGRKIGYHLGQHRYTIGQRRGVGVAAAGGEAVYVIEKDAAANTITVGPRERLLAAGCTALEANWLAPREGLPRDGAWGGCFAKFRYNAEPVAARFRVVEDAAGATPSGRVGAFEVEFDEPQSAVAPGQAIVLYEADQPECVIGGGWIGAARAGG